LTRIRTETKMLIYHFRITSDEHEDFLREIEIQPKQTFLDFHAIILESAELIHCDQASFFLTDKKYKKDKEIALKADKRQVRKYDEDLDQVVTEIVTPPLMRNAKLNQYIEDPHQKMIYDFSGREHHSFFIELFKILKSDGIPSYPRCVKRIGELPKRIETPVVPPVKPITPKITVPKIPVIKNIFPIPEEEHKIEAVVEDESEIIAIESQIGNLFKEEEPVSADIPASIADEDDGYSYGHDPEEMDHIEDYDDIESIDNRFDRFDQDDDY